MRTTLDIPDDLYRQAKAQAAHENRRVKDLVTEGLQLVLSLSKERSSRPLRRMSKPPVTIRPGNIIRALSNDAMAEVLEQSGERLP